MIKKIAATATEIIITKSPDSHKSFSIIGNFKIQIFSGNRNEAENTISEYKILYK